mmetsp:Transcript_79337/g.97029  ORF Transcript_79337/g.97029 Transcript_79337/m.97029 type:complete len:371 (+) Transcript_79337:32-1144(+)
MDTDFEDSKYVDDDTTEADLLLNDIAKSLKDTSFEAKLKALNDQPMPEDNVLDKLAVKYANALMNYADINSKSLINYINDRDHRTIQNVINEYYRLLSETQNVLRDCIDSGKSRIRSIDSLHKMFKKKLNKMKKDAETNSDIDLDCVLEQKMLSDNEQEKLKILYEQLTKSSAAAIIEIQAKWTELEPKIKKLVSIIERYKDRAESEQSKNFNILKKVNNAANILFTLAGVVGIALLFVAPPIAGGIVLLSVPVLAAIYGGAKYHIKQKVKKSTNDAKKLHDLAFNMYKMSKKLDNTGGNQMDFLKKDSIYIGQNAIIGNADSIIQHLVKLRKRLVQYIKNARELRKDCIDALKEFNTHLLIKRMDPQIS